MSSKYDGIACRYRSCIRQFVFQVNNTHEDYFLCFMNLLPAQTHSKLISPTWAGTRDSKNVISILILVCHLKKMGGLNIHCNNDTRKIWTPLYLMVGLQYDKKSTEIIEYQRTIAHIHCITKQLWCVSVIFMEGKIIKCNIFHTKWSIHYEKSAWTFLSPLFSSYPWLIFSFEIHF